MAFVAKDKVGARGVGDVREGRESGGIEVKVAVKEEHPRVADPLEAGEQRGPLAGVGGEEDQQDGGEPLRGPAQGLRRTIGAAVIDGDDAIGEAVGAEERVEAGEVGFGAVGEVVEGQNNRKALGEEGLGVCPIREVHGALGIQVGEGDAVVHVDGAVVAVTGLAVFVLGMADGASTGTDEVDEGVLLAVDAGLEDLEGLAGGLALLPEHVAGGGPEGQGAGLEGELHGLTVGVGDEDDLLGVDVLNGHGDDIVLVLVNVGGDLGDLGEVEVEGEALFEFVAHGGPFGYLAAGRPVLAGGASSSPSLAVSAFGGMPPQRTMMRSVMSQSGFT